MDFLRKISFACTVICLTPFMALADSGVIIYNFDEAGAEIAFDQSGNGAEIKISTSAVMSNEQPKFGPGSLKIEPKEKALGSGWYREDEAGSVVGINKNFKALTVACWLRPADPKGSYILLRRMQRKSAKNTVTFSLVNGVLAFSVNLEGGQQVVRYPIVNLVKDQWIHLAVTFSEGDVILYVNAEAVANNGIPFLEIPAPTDVTSFAALINAPKGTFMDDYAVFGKALDPNEIQHIYSDGLNAFSHASK